MDILSLNIFAQNIQASQIKAVLPTELHTKEGIEQERHYFLGWLKDEFSKGIVYKDQLTAWFWYKLYIDFGMYDEEDVNEPNWMSEIENILENKLVLGNYNESRGQL